MRSWPLLNDLHSVQSHPRPHRRFFNNPREFEAEHALYRDPLLAQLLPTLHHATNNADGAISTHSLPGHHIFPFPAFMVLERGATLSDWCSRLRNYGEVLGMIESLARLLTILHSAGCVHRDLKPDNVLLLLESTEWKLIDLGIVARAGACSALPAKFASYLLLYCWPKCVIEQERCKCLC